MSQHVSTSARLHETNELARVFVRSKNSFENLVVWQESQKTVVMIYTLSRVWKDYGLKDQIQRAMVSVVSNIAEGYERGSKIDFTRFLYIARGSVSEVRAQMYVARDLKYIDQQEFELVYDKLDYIARMLGKLISSNKSIN